MSDSVALAFISYLPPTLVALTGLAVAIVNVFHLGRVDNALLDVQVAAAKHTASATSSPPASASSSPPATQC